MAQVNPVFAGLGTTIFTQMSALARETGAINLGQGFPDEDGPIAIREAAVRALIDGPNQYPPSSGLPALRAALSRHANTYWDLGFDPDAEVLVTSGATEALSAAIMAFARPGSTVGLIAPAYDCYRPIAEASGAQVRMAALTPPDWTLDDAALDTLFDGGLDVLVLNSPMNPTGKVFTQDELTRIAGRMAAHGTLGICDEVYEHLTFGAEHVPLMTLPGMRERCVRVGSAGKIFSLTGWKIGWVQGPASLVSVVAKAHQFLTFTTPPALQIGVAHGLEHEMAFPLDLARTLAARRDRLAHGLSSLGFRPLPCAGTYFLTVDAAALLRAGEDDRALAVRLAREAGVAAIPLSPFYGTGAPRGLLRFAFCKREALLDEAVARLTRCLAP